MDILIIILQFFLSLSILVVLHEFGHFLPARLFKTKVEKFYLFFDAGFSLFKKKIGDTEYGIGWLPLGGYVKIAGMIDESMDTEQMKGEPQPWEFRSKPAWQRLIIMLGGVTVNFLLGFLLFAIILTVWGEDYLPASSAKYGIYTDSLARDMGLRDGDKVLKIGDKVFDKFDSRQLIKGVVIDGVDNVSVERDGQVMDVAIDPMYITELSSYKNKGAMLFAPRTPLEILKVSPNTGADKAGMKAGDKIISVDGNDAKFYDQFNNHFDKSPNQTQQIQILRGPDFMDLQVTTDENGIMGVQWHGMDHYFEVKKQTYTFMEALPMGVSKGYNFLADQVKAFGQMFSGKIKASDSLGGFATIAQLFPTTWNWESFWHITAILSLILGFMNLLPIPALDGGHVMFLLYEIVSGRKPSDRFMEITTIAGFALILGLLLFANGLDVWRYFGK